MSHFGSVLIANRGEIAVRIIRTLRHLGIASVAVYTDADRDAPHVGQADRAVALGPPGAYLDVDRIVDAARRSGADALHPGYGFLAENPILARRTAEAGVVFVGPPPAAIEMMGDKINAKQAVAAAGVPVVPGRDRAGLTDAELIDAARDVGLPVLLKPSAGGGGKGMRRVEVEADLPAQIASARREALGAFGDDTLLVERWVSRPRHIEVQVFADTHGTTVALGERECSLQRRHQKIVEEAPSPLLDTLTRRAMGASAVAAARACGYVGAGTVEFIVPGDRPDEYFFMEMNTRLQVEHPVTEMVLGVDLVEWQLRVAAGERLPWSEARPPLPIGHAVEARVYAEDPARGFLPAVGPVLRLAGPIGDPDPDRTRGDAHPVLRIDSGLAEGVAVGTQYDPMLAKIVAWGEDRGEALARLRSALATSAVLGVTTNMGFLRRLLADDDVVAGRLDTELVERVADRLAGPDRPPEAVLAAAGLLDAAPARPAQPSADPWDAPDGWRVGGPAPRRTRWRYGGDVVEVTTSPAGVRVGDGALRPASGRVYEAELEVEIDGIRTRYTWAVDGDTVWLGRDGDAWPLTRWIETIDHAGPTRAGAGPLTSPMPGTVLAVPVVEGDAVRAGQTVAVVEAMKMEHAVVAPHDGTVIQVLVRPGDAVRLEQPLAVVEPAVDRVASVQGGE